MAPANLSQKDAHTLNLLFSPESVAPPPKPPVNESLPQDRHYPNDVLKTLADVEARAVSFAEEKDEPAHSLSLLNELLTTHPLYASAYNNRAQLLRLHPKLMDNSEEQTLSDLARAIELASPEKEGDEVSEAQARVLKNAYSQRGAVWVSRKEEEKAMADFEKAAKWGSEVAREYVVKNNPYAKLCGEMVKEVMRKEMGMSGPQ